LWWILLTLAVEAVVEAAAHEQAAALAAAACEQAALVGALLSAEEVVSTGAARWQETGSGMLGPSLASPIRSVRETSVGLADLI